MFKNGEIVELNFVFKKDKVEKGAIAKIVDGEKLFPKLYDKLKNNGQYSSHMTEFCCIVWDKKNIHYKGAHDGFYLMARFDLFAGKMGDYDFSFEDEEITKEFDFEEPKNNEGRKTCYWCGEKTVKKLGFMSYYDMCPKCDI